VAQQLLSTSVHLGRSVQCSCFTTAYTRRCVGRAAFGSLRHLHGISACRHCTATAAVTPPSAQPRQKSKNGRGRRFALPRHGHGCSDHQQFCNAFCLDPDPVARNQSTMCNSCGLHHGRHLPPSRSCPGLLLPSFSFPLTFVGMHSGSTTTSSCSDKSSAAAEGQSLARLGMRGMPRELVQRYFFAGRANTLRGCSTNRS